MRFIACCGATDALTPSPGKKKVRGGVHRGPQMCAVSPPVPEHSIPQQPMHQDFLHEFSCIMRSLSAPGVVHILETFSMPPRKRGPTDVNRHV
eukprot:1021941-Pelagomonas_calceolata.AAC.1